jgi:hypothetical protein
MTSTARRRAKPARFGLYYYDYGKSFFVWKVTIPGEGPQLSDELEGQGIKNALGVTQSLSFVGINKPQEAHSP